MCDTTTRETANFRVRFWRRDAALVLLCGVIGAIAAGCGSHDNHQESRDSRQDSQKAEQNVATDSHIPEATRQMIQERNKAMRTQRPGPK